MSTPKALGGDFLGRFREIVSDPLNLLIERSPNAGHVEDGFVTLHNGLCVPLSGKASYYGEFSNILVINRGVHEPLEEFVFQEVLRRLPSAPRILELGAYWGHYSMWLKTLFPDGLAWLVEPDERHLNVGRANFKRNRLDGEFIQGFVGRGQFEVDAFLAERGIAKLDILHADIQAHELNMLEGAAEALGSQIVDYVFVSTHSQALHHSVCEQLERFGYRVEVSSDFEVQSTSFDGLVFACLPSKSVFEDFALLGREEIYSSTPAQLVDYIEACKRSRERASAGPTRGDLRQSSPQA